MMKKTTLALLATLAGTVAFAQTVLLDFRSGTATTLLSNTDPANGDVYNNIPTLGTTTTVLDLVDSNGDATTIDFGFATSNSQAPAAQTNTAGAPPSPFDTVFAATAYNDTSRSNTDGEVWTITFTGLEDTKKYDISIWAKSGVARPLELSTYAITTGSATSTTPLADLNLTTVGTFTQFMGVTPSSGQIQWTLTDVGATAGRALAMNAIEITAIPEPGTLALLGLAMGYLFYRRKR